MPKKLTIEECKKLAEDRGGKCLNDKYINSSTLMKWRCKDEHEWKTCFNSIKNGRWCATCKGLKKKTIDDCKKVAKEKGGECLSDEYIGANSKMLWRCDKGHQWYATFGMINYKTWCGECYGTKRKSIDDCKRIAKERGGECLETEYINNRTKMLWTCSKGHKWYSKFNSITGMNTWCPYCSNSIKKNIEQCKEHAITKGGECLSEEYVNSDSNLLWKCCYGHEWIAPFGRIMSGSWCNECGGTKKKTIEDCIRYAEEKGGKCLSKKYIDNRGKILWVCEFGHEWYASFASINNGHWCHECGGVKRQTLEDCKIVASEKGGECLSEEYINGFTNMLWRCGNGHEWNTTFMSIKHKSWCQECVGTKKKTLEDCIDISTKRGGRCLSNEYVNDHTKMLWECKDSHRWYATFHGISIGGTWCPFCYGKVKHTIEKCKELASSRGGFCLSTEYVNVFGKLTWMCSKGHKWGTCYSVVQKGAWCPRCNESRGERFVGEYLTKNNIDYEREKRINGGYRFDLANFNDKWTIEYDGVQHFKPVDFFGGEKALEGTKKRDAIKNNYCVENGISLLRISCSSKNVERQLDLFFSSVNNGFRTYMYHGDEYLCK